MTGTELGLVTVMCNAELGFKQQYVTLYMAVFEALDELRQYTADHSEILDQAI